MDIALIIFFIFFFAILIRIVVGWYLNERAPEEQTEALLVKKRTSVSVDANGMPNRYYYLTFSVNGDNIRFSVGRKVFKRYEENMKGTLVFKRKRFVDFIVQ